MHNMMRLTLILVLLIFSGIAHATDPILRQGNRNYHDGDFHAAELQYRRALEQNPQDERALYNLSNVLYRQGRFEEAANILEGLSNMNIRDSQRADVLHNLGNAKVGEKKFSEGIEAYKNSLRIRPDDMDTRHNLAYARQLLEEQQQQQQQQQDQNDQKDDQDQKDEQQTPPDQQPDDDQQQQQQQPRPDQISPQDAERILDALNQQEQKVQENIDREEKKRVPARVQKEW
jgi:Ca-activated chloride channel homolog